jgi:hypothetical protein
VAPLPQTPSGSGSLKASPEVFELEFQTRAEPCCSAPEATHANGWSAKPSASNAENGFDTRAAWFSVCRSLLSFLGDVTRLATRAGCGPAETGSIPVRHPIDVPSAMPFALRGPTRPCGFRFGRTVHPVRSRFESGCPLTKTRGFVTRAAWQKARHVFRREMPRDATGVAAPLSME